jgi:hypothetical protein
MLSLSCPPEEYVGFYTLTMVALCFIIIFGPIFTSSLEFVYLPFVECDISTVIWSLEFYYLD